MFWLIQLGILSHFFSPSNICKNLFAFGRFARSSMCTNSGSVNRTQRISSVIWGVTEVEWNLIDFYIGFWGFFNIDSKEEKRKMKKREKKTHCLCFRLENSIYIPSIFTELKERYLRKSLLSGFGNFHHHVSLQFAPQSALERWKRVAWLNKNIYWTLNMFSRNLQIVDVENLKHVRWFIIHQEVKSI